LKNKIKILILTSALRASCHSCHVERILFLVTTLFRSPVALNGKDHLENGSLVDGTLDFNPSAMVLHDHVTDRQSQTGTPAIRPGRKKRIEYFIQMFFGDPEARIGKFHDNGLSPRTILFHPAPDIEGAALGIAKHALLIRLTNTCRISSTSIATSGKLPLQDVVITTLLNLACSLTSGIVSWTTMLISDFTSRGGFLREKSRRFFRISPGVKRLPLHGPQVLLFVSWNIVGLEQQARISQDAGQRIVHLVGDVRCQFADGRQLCALQQLALRHVKLVRHGVERLSQFRKLAPRGIRDLDPVLKLPRATRWSPEIAGTSGQVPLSVCR
jgi:hypothetical protein